MITQLLLSSFLTVLGPHEQVYDLDIMCVDGKTDHCVVALPQGQPAPFSGHLMTAELALWFGQEIEKTRAEATAMLARSSSVAKARMTLMEIDHAAQIRRLRREKLALEKVVDDSPNVFVWCAITAAAVGMIASGFYLHQAFKK